MRSEQLLATVPPAMASMLAERTATVRVLGSFPAAVYLRLTDGSVIAVLRPGAVRLPIGALLLADAAVPDSLAFVRSAGIRGGRLELDGLSIATAGYYDPSVTPVGKPSPRAVAHAESLLQRHRQHLARSGVPLFEAAYLDDVIARQQPTLEAESIRPYVMGLIGRGPGLTPAGDDLLCGLLIGTVAFDDDPAPWCAAVRNALDRPAATTDLSRALLLAACDGDGLPELQRCANALAGRCEADVDEAFTALLAIGATSGYALATGFVAVARRALTRHRNLLVAG